MSKIPPYSLDLIIYLEQTKSIHVILFDRKNIV